MYGLWIVVITRTQLLYSISSLWNRVQIVRRSVLVREEYTRRIYAKKVVTRRILREESSGEENSAKKIPRP